MRVVKGFKMNLYILGEMLCPFLVTYFSISLNRAVISTFWNKSLNLNEISEILISQVL